MSSLRLPHGWDFPSAAVAGWNLICVCRWRQSDGSGRWCWSQRGRGNQLSTWLRGRSRPRSWHQKLRRPNKSTKLLVVPWTRTSGAWGVCSPLHRGVMLPGRDCITVGQASSATLILPCWVPWAELQLALLPCSLGQQEVCGRSIAVLLLGKRRLCVCETVLICTLKLS